MLNNFRIGTRLFWQALGMAFWFVVLVAVAIVSMRDLNRDTAAVYLDKLEPGSIVLRIQTLMSETNLRLLQDCFMIPLALRLRSMLIQ